VSSPVCTSRDVTAAGAAASLAVTHDAKWWAVAPGIPRKPDGEVVGSEAILGFVGRVVRVDGGDDVFGRLGVGCGRRAFLESVRTAQSRSGGQYSFLKAK
jgi:hypothetical protein